MDDKDEAILEQILNATKYEGTQSKNNDWQAWAYVKMLNTPMRQHFWTINAKFISLTKRERVMVHFIPSS